MSPNYPLLAHECKCCTREQLHSSQHAVAMPQRSTLTTPARLVNQLLSALLLA